MNIPLLIGGATASALHTAVKIAPLYDGPVVYIRDAAAIPSMMQKLMSDSRQQIIAELMAEQDLLRRQYAQKSTKLSVVEARMRRQLYADEPIKPPFEGLKDMAFKVSEIRNLINWRAFFAVWKLDASFAQLAQIDGCDHCRAMWLASVAQEQRVKAAEAMQLHKEACRVLDALSDYEVKARVVFVPAGSKNESVVYSYNGVEYEIDAPRQRHREGEGLRLSLADFIKPVSEQGELTDWIALFAVTVGMELQSKIENFKSDGDDYNTILYQALADRLAEAATEMMHRSVKRGDIEIRPAIGYPSLPDQRLVFVVEPAICYDQMGIELTENGAMYPPSSTTGLIICNRDCRYFSVD